MKKYLVEKILKVDGIERFVLVKDTSDNKKLKMYFLSDMEDYVETFENMKDIKKGDILEGRLLIVFVCESIKINDKKNEQSSRSFHFKSLVNKSNKIS